MTRGGWVGSLRPLVVVLAACSSDEVKDPSYLLVQLSPVPVGAVVPGVARVDVKSGATTIAAVCVNLGDGAGATLALKRDPAKNQGARITIEVTAYETLSGQTNVGPGDEFTCPPELPPALAPPQTVSVAFCSAQAKRVVFHVGATCGCSSDGGAGGEGGGSSSSSSSAASTGSTGGGGMGGAGGTGAGGSGGATVGAGGGSGGSAGSSGGAGGSTGGASSSSATSSAVSSSSSGAGGGGGGPGGCGCGSAQTCGAGLSTEGRTCGPTECCNINVSTPCALEAAK